MGLRWLLSNRKKSEKGKERKRDLIDKSKKKKRPQERSQEEEAGTAGRAGTQSENRKEYLFPVALCRSASAKVRSDRYFLLQSAELQPLCFIVVCRAAVRVSQRLGQHLFIVAEA
jgi:hypothetical protein